MSWSINRSFETKGCAAWLLTVLRWDDNAEQDKVVATRSQIEEENTVVVVSVKNAEGIEAVLLKGIFVVTIGVAGKRSSVGAKIQGNTLVVSPLQALRQPEIAAESP